MMIFSVPQVGSSNKQQQAAVEAAEAGEKGSTSTEKEMEEVGSEYRKEEKKE